MLYRHEKRLAHLHYVNFHSGGKGREEVDILLPNVNASPFLCFLLVYRVKPVRRSDPWLHPFTLQMSTQINNNVQLQPTQYTYSGPDTVLHALLILAHAVLTSSQ